MVGSAWRIAVEGLAIVGAIAATYIALDLVGLALKRNNPVLFFLIPFIQGGCLGFAQGRLSGEQAASPLAAFFEGGKRLYLRLLGIEALVLGTVPLGILSALAISMMPVVVAAVLPALARIIHQESDGGVVAV